METALGGGLAEAAGRGGEDLEKGERGGRG